MSVGMFLHRLAPPRPKSHSFAIEIPTTVSRRNGSIKLVFYVPLGYRRPSWYQTGSETDILNDPTYPVVVNFHGGGFTLGSPTDDARWAHAITENVKAIVVSVGYRLAPEHPFPTGVEDGVDAILWLSKYGKSLGLDCANMALSGFSSGGNLCFAVSLRLEAEVRKLRAKALKSDDIDVAKPRVLVSWYPSVDYTLSRAERRASNPGGTGKSLPTSLTDLFDAAYLHPPHTIAVDDPYLSPGIADGQLLIEALPKDIVLYTCEWDQLFIEGETFRVRLGQLGKYVKGRTVLGVRHGWDHSPHPFRTDLKAEIVYQEACAELSRGFEGR